MSPELDQKMCATYPLIFRDRRSPPRETAMCWGFSCGDGWYALIDTVCSLSMREMPENPPVALQVKEKFGGLSMLKHGGNQRTRAFGEFAEVMS